MFDEMDVSIVPMVRVVILVAFPGVYLFFWVFKCVWPIEFASSVINTFHYVLYDLVFTITLCNI